MYIKINFNLTFQYCYSPWTHYTSELLIYILINIHNGLYCCSSFQLSSAFEQPLGSVVLPIRELLSKPDLLMDQWLSLDGAGPDTQILLRAQLKVKRWFLLLFINCNRINLPFSNCISVLKIRNMYCIWISRN